MEHRSALGGSTLALALRTGSMDRAPDFGVVENEFRVLEEVLPYLFARDLLGGGLAGSTLSACRCSQYDRSFQQSSQDFAHGPLDLPVRSLFSGYAR